MEYQKKLENTGFLCYNVIVKVLWRYGYKITIICNWQIFYYQGGRHMLSKEELTVVIDQMLRCVGYELKSNSLKEIVAKNGINNWIIPGRPNILTRHQKTVFEFIDEHSDANLNAVAWYEGDVLNFVVENNFVKVGAPWYHTLPIWKISYDTSKNTSWFLYRYHAIVGSVDENKQFKANRIPVIMNKTSETALTIDGIIEELDKYFDPELTADVVEQEIETDLGETYGLPDLIRFFKDRKIL